jgi:hypothetical protein
MISLTPRKALHFEFRKYEMFFDDDDDDEVTQPNVRVAVPLSGRAPPQPKPKAAAPAPTAVQPPVVRHVAPLVAAVDSAFLYDETYDDDVAAVRAAKHAAAGEGGAGEGSKFGDAITAAQQQRARDKEAVGMRRVAETRKAEAGDEALAALDRERGSYVTEGYRRKLRERSAAEEAEAQEEQAEASVGFRRRGTAAVAAAASAVAVDDADDDYFAALVKPTAAAAPLPAPAGTEHAAPVTAAPKPEDPTAATSVTAPADAVGPSDAPPSSASAAGAAEAVAAKGTVLQKFDEAMSALEDGKKRRRLARRLQRLSPHDIAEAATRFQQHAQRRRDELQKVA